jgi:hypothetical protein
VSTGGQQIVNSKRGNPFCASRRAILRRATASGYGGQNRFFPLGGCLCFETAARLPEFAPWKAGLRTRVRCADREGGEAVAQSSGHWSSGKPAATGPP